MIRKVAREELLTPTKRKLVFFCCRLGQWDLINGSIGCPAVEDGILLSEILIDL